MSKVILITGTSTGLGKALAVELAAQGNKVYATMRNTDKQDALLTAAKAADTHVNVLQLDVQDSDSVSRCVSHILGAEGNIDVLVNNAGAGMVKPAELAKEEDIQWSMDVNFMGVVRCTQAVLPSMRKARSGHIVNISSVGGLVGQPFSEIYCAAKFAVEGFVESLASYVTPSFGVNFTNVEPGGIVSEFVNNSLEQLTSAGGIGNDEYQAVFEKFLASGAGSSRDDLYQTADAIAKIVADTIANNNPPLRLRTSAWAEEFTSFKTQLDPTGELQTKRVTETFLG